MNSIRKTAALFAVLVMVSTCALAVVQSDGSDADDQTWYDARVTPFTFPESKGIPILQAMKQAESTIDVAIYLLTSYNVLSLLLEKQKQGVQVRIVIEGQPEFGSLGNFTQAKILKNLVDAGAQVHVINYDGITEKTYYFFHNKYAVIDLDTVVVTSENWTTGNFDSGDGNRGWGAVVESSDYARYLDTQVFENDFTLDGDVKNLTDVYPDLDTYTSSLSYSIGTYKTTTYSAKVAAVYSPDNSWQPVKNLMLSAESRLYCEEMSVDSDFIASTDNPYTWLIDSSEKGIDTRFVMYTGDDTPEEHPQRDVVDGLNDYTDVIASGSPYTDTFMHNKGIVADDKVLVGSINWTDTSMLCNREMDVLIWSKEVSDYFAKEFLWDLYSGYIPGGDKEVCEITYVVDGKVTALNYIKGDKVILPDDPTKSSHSVYYYTFSHWDGYTEGMTADDAATITAVFDRHTILDDNTTFVYVMVAIGVLAALCLCYWYVRHGRAES